jgi:hypothetical protein
MSCGESSCDIVLDVWFFFFNSTGSMTFSVLTSSYVALNFRHYFLKCRCYNSGK